MIALERCFASLWTSLSREWHLDGATYVNAPVSTMLNTTSIKACDGCWSALWRRPTILFFCLSNLACFSINGNFLIGSDASTLAACDFMSANNKVADSKCNLLTSAVSPTVAAPNNLVASSVTAVSLTGFWGEPKEKASVEKFLIPSATNFWWTSGCSSSHLFLKLPLDSMRAMVSVRKKQSTIRVYKFSVYYHGFNLTYIHQDWFYYS